MPTFTTYDGTELTATVLGGPADPVVVLPGGPLRDWHYLGNLAGLDAHRELVVLELPHRRVDQLVDDVEALRQHLGRDTLDVIGHSAGANLALLYAAAYPDRVGKLALITPGVRVVGLRPTDEEQVAVYEQRAHEPWYADARAAMDAWDAGTETPEQRQLAQAFVYGRWDDAARAHVAAGEATAVPDAFEIYYGDGTFDVEATRAGLAKVGGDVLVLVGNLDAATPVRLGIEVGELFAHAEVVVQSGAGHFPWLDDPTWFVGTLSRFLATR
ncbi:MAG TPA: alpha/beta hydrolase [Jatrophihabitantaceae bacterium]|jgi:pimeloyl-ACP methyl ester carboxylesterase